MLIKMFTCLWTSQLNKIFYCLWKRFEWADPGVPLMPKFCEPQELLLKSEMGSTLAPHFEKNFIQIVYMKNY